MPTVLIIEDELPNVLRMEKMLHQLDSSIMIVDRLQTVQDSIIWLQTHAQPDIIFMDIRLTDGLSFEIFSHVEVTAPVIFITAYDEYALKAFEVNGIDYLLKPLDVDKLAKSLKKAVPKDRQTNEILLQTLKELQTREVSYRNRFLVFYRDTYVLVMTSEIAYFSSENKTTFLHTFDNKRYVIEQTLENLEKELDPDVFFRASRQYIVSLKSIHKIHLFFNSQLKIELSPSDGEAITLSREKSSQLKKWLNQFPSNKL
ncbi:LytTR family two component transcriptional regulator [Pedobacter psychrotolerans]|uniref:DNA-binding response regulator n=1 Tax=Pedobacter psychrotolerans TaxID=1843235 RepID=A0A4R2HMV3_9SPHI|nr:LytTR family DNA-binding domain-containing protein [Pedobacter psychrotolerans]TCO31175.1 LytTR family two component transcriptional regulator [Pedobacter psychrotolerans]GGE41703.1 DNA-binding response regulator [Pedobacter psychrotolerans]